MLKKFGSLMGSILKLPMMFALKPLGGSFVILIPFYRMRIGKSADG